MTGARIVLVSGPPGAGKTTLARPLAGALGFALLSKDDIKEPLYDALGAVRGDMDASRRIGAASWRILWALAPQMPRLVLEANFHPDSAYERARIAALPGACIEVYCRCPPAEVARRFKARAASPGHHPAHVIADLPQSVIESEFGRPMGLCPVLEVDTSSAVDVVALAQRIAQMWQDHQ